MDIFEIAFNTPENVDENPDPHDDFYNRDEWSDLQSLSIPGVKGWIIYRTRMVETHYGPELTVEFWVDGKKESTLHHSQEAMGAEDQIRRFLDDILHDWQDYPDDPEIREMADLWLDMK